MNFTSFNLHPSIQKNVEELGYDTPTPIQEQAIPYLLQGEDVLGLAQTGTGKTAAFVLPILQHLRSGPRGKLRALIIAPTRELAEQINDSIVALGSNTGLRSLTVYGGVSANNQIAGLKKGIDIVVACPGRLLDHLKEGKIGLGSIEMLVIDEADRMFDMGFLPDIRRIMKYVPKRRQTMLFSATMPEDIRRLANDFLFKPVTIKIDFTKPLDTVSHALYPVKKHLKTPLLIELLHHTDTESVLVFTRTKHRAKRLGIQLNKMGYKVASLQGNMSQNQRQTALNGFKNGTYQVLIATDIAARGIDVTSISHVINYDIPDTPDAYTHRIGRTGRAAKTGDAFTMITDEDEQIVRIIERLMGKKIERRIMEGFDYDKPAPPRTHGHGSGNYRKNVNPHHSGKNRGGSPGSVRVRPENSGNKSNPHRHGRVKRTNENRNRKRRNSR